MESESEEDSIATTTRLPSLYSKKELEILSKLANSNKKLGSTDVVYQMSHIWSEAKDIKNTKLIRRDNSFQDSPEKLILSGPIIYVANPLAKTPRDNCKSKGDYDVIDLFEIPNDYLPRVNLVPNLEMKSYHSNLPKVFWSETILHTDYFRCFLRSRISSENERTLICSLIPSGITHIDTIYSISFEDEAELLNGVALWASLPLDYVAKNAGVLAIRPNFFATLPWVKLPSTALHRVLQLNCLTTWYAPIWDRQASKLSADNWSDNRLSLVREGPMHTTDTWSRSCGLRSDFARRQALLEIDVLAIMELGLDIEDLLYMYDIQFPVMQLYDKDTYFDQNGRIVFTASKNLVGVGLSSNEWEKCKNLKEGSITKEILDDTMLDGPIERTIKYEAPFILPDRKEDYGRAWEYFYPKYGRKS